MPAGPNPPCIPSLLNLFRPSSQETQNGSRLGSWLPLYKFRKD